MKKNAIAKLGTERSSKAAVALDTKSALQIARLINGEDQKVAKAVRRALPQIAKAIDTIAAVIDSGGRLIYVGAGTSGRIAALDAAECPPTFNSDPETVQYVMAGGEAALGRAAEANEDSRGLGISDIAGKNPGPKDVIVGLTASGRTPYTIGAVDYAKSRGAKTVAIVCNKKSPLGKVADIEIALNLGPEVISGSTRMKAGTAQKLVCNMLTTGAFTRLGYVYGNLMVNVHPKNEKLVERALQIIMEVTGKDRKKAESLLEASGGRVPVALVMVKRSIPAAEAEVRLQRAKGNVRKAIDTRN